jgi:hypothetical protein
MSTSGPSRHSGRMPNLIVIRGITDMARLSAGSIRSRLTHLGHGPQNWVQGAILTEEAFDKGDGSLRRPKGQISPIAAAPMCYRV